MNGRTYRSLTPDETEAIKGLCKMDQKVGASTTSTTKSTRLPTFETDLKFYSPNGPTLVAKSSASFVTTNKRNKPYQTRSTVAKKYRRMLSSTSSSLQKQLHSESSAMPFSSASSFSLSSSSSTSSITSSSTPLFNSIEPRLTKSKQSRLSQAPLDNTILTPSSLVPPPLVVSPRQKQILLTPYNSSINRLKYDLEPRHSSPSTSLPEAARLILEDHERITSNGAGVLKLRSNMLFEPGKMFIKTERSSARRAYDVCHVLEQVGVVERIKIKKKKGYLWLGLTNVAEYMNRNYLKRLPRRENNLPLPSLFSTSFSRSSSTSSSTSSSSSLSKSTKRRRKLDNIVLPLPENITSLPILCDLTRTYIEIMIKRREIGVYLSSRNIIQRICNTTASSGNILKKTQVQRRIYDVLGVLEIVGVVKKKYKPKEYCLNTLAFQTSMSADFTKTTLLKCQELKSPKHEEKEEEGAEEDAGYKIKGEDKVGCEFPIPRTASLNMMMSAKNQSSLSSCKTPKKRSRDITDHFHKTEKEKNDRKKIRKKTKQ